MPQAVAEGVQPSATAAELAAMSEVMLAVLPHASAVGRTMLGVE